MQLSSEFTPCPYCAVNNMPARDVCWRCGTPLPSDFAMDGTRCAAFVPPASPLAPGQLESLLAQAEILCPEDYAMPAPAPEEAPCPTWNWRSLFRSRQHA